MAFQKNDGGISEVWWRLFKSRDRRGVAAIEAAFVLPPFLTLLIGMIELGVYFTLQSALDVGVLATAEAQRTAMLAASTYTLPSVSTLKTSIRTYGGMVLNVSNLSVDVRSLASLAASSVAIGSAADDACPTNSSSAGSAGSGASGPNSVMVLRAQTTMTLLPSTMIVTMTSTSIFSCPL